jgi:protein SCO1/2
MTPILQHAMRPRSPGSSRGIAVLAGALLLAAAVPAGAYQPNAAVRPAILKEVAFDQRVNEPVPADLIFRDEQGKPVRLGDFMGKRPIVLALVYYRCQDLCPLLLDGLARAVQQVGFSVGKEFEVLAVSFDPRDTPTFAALKRAEMAQKFGWGDAARRWHFLTGTDGPIRQLTSAVGFHYAFDPATEEFAHAAGLVVLTPKGRIFRYLFGVEFPPRNLRLSLVEASGERLGTPLDQVLLFCYHYDPSVGKYSVMVLNVLRLAGLLTVGALGSFFLAMRQVERRRRRRAAPREA